MADIATTTNGTSPVAAEASNAEESSSKSEKMTELAMNLLVQGRRHLLVSDIPSAISALAESSRLLVERFGEFADECAESYYYYGLALLEMARTDSDVLGDAVEGGDKADDDDEEAPEDEDKENAVEDEESEEEENGEAEELTNGKSVENEGGSSNGTETNGEAKEAKAEEEKSEDVDMKEDTLTNGEKATETKIEEQNGKPKNEAKGKSLKAAGSASTETKSENGDAAEEETGEEVTNLQLAWEVFELAKQIYKRKSETDPAAIPRLADALIRLAEVAIESENYTSAIEDLLKCLEIQTTSFPPDSRSLAETHYQLGVAYTFTTEFKEAVRSFEAAASVIKLRIENLKNPVEKKPSMEEPKNLFHTIEGEIEELEALLPDIREKIADTIDLEKEAVRKIAENVLNGAGSSSAEAGGSSSVEPPMTTSESPAKPAMDITHLIRKKRKPEDVEAEASAPKKVCAEAEPVV